MIWDTDRKDEWVGGVGWDVGSSQERKRDDCVCGGKRARANDSRVVKGSPSNFLQTNEEECFMLHNHFSSESNPSHFVAKLNPILAVTRTG